MLLLLLFLASVEASRFISRYLILLLNNPRKDCTHQWNNEQQRNVILLNQLCFRCFSKATSTHLLFVSLNSLLFLHANKGLFKIIVYFE